MSAAISSGLNYSLKPSSVKINRKTIPCQSSNKLEFAPGETAHINLPSLPNHVLDGQSAYLKFKVTITNGCYVDGTAQSFIERINTIGPGGQQISDISLYRSIAAGMIDLQLSQSDKIGMSPALGCEDVYFTPASSANATYNLNTAGEFAKLVPNANRKGKLLANGQTYSFCIPLLHPLFSMSEKYWPCFAMSSDTRLEFTWAAASDALVSTDANNVATYVLKNPEIIIDALELDSSVFPLISSTYQGRDLIIPSQTYSYYASQLSAGAIASQSAIIPAKQMSARAMFFRFKPAQTQATTAYSTGSSVNVFHSEHDSFCVNIGGADYPTHRIVTDVASNFSNYWSATQTALHAFNALEMNGSLNETQYNKFTTATGYSLLGDSHNNAFIVGINLDSLRGQNQTTNSGLNLSGVTTYWKGYLGAAPKNSLGNDQVVSIDCFVLHDILLIVDSQGNVTLKS